MTFAVKRIKISGINTRHSSLFIKGMNLNSKKPLYEEPEYTNKYLVEYPKYGLIVYITILTIPGVLIILGWLSMLSLGGWDWKVVTITIFYIVAGIGGCYWIPIRIYWKMYRTYRNTVKVTEEGIRIGKWYFPKDAVEKSVYNLHNGHLYIYLKNGKKFKICKDISKISPFGGDSHFNFTAYGKALKKIGIPFEVVRKKGLFKTETIRGRELYKEMSHRKRYKRWLGTRK